MPAVIFHLKMYLKLLMMIKHLRLLKQHNIVHMCEPQTEQENISLLLPPDLLLMICLHPIEN